MYGRFKYFIFALSLRLSDRHFKADLIRKCDICMDDLSILFSHFPYVSLIGILKLI